MDYNKFIDKHKTRYCVHFDCSDYYSELRHFGIKGPVTQKATGKIIPTPNKLIRGLAAKLPGDTAVRSEAGGKVQRLIVADKATFQKLIGSAQVHKGDNRPCTYHAAVRVTANRYKKYAEDAGLL